MSTVYSVFQINNYIKNMFRQDILLSGTIQVQGEVSNCKDHSTGLYFTLKDEKAVISCVMFRSAAAGLAFSLRPGDNVIVTGTIDAFVRNGVYQLYAKKIEKNGAGALYEQYLKLKEKLEDMGMFADQYKQQIPAFAQKIGVVTAPTGAVIQDIQNVARRRHPGVSIWLYPSLVQGAGAAPELIRGIRALDRMGLDVIIIGRGGGSIEDLWAFNEEAVAQAVFDAETPIISAVGHETDWVITDFVADLRAPTPSAAAELAVPDVREMLNRLMDREADLFGRMQNALALAKRSLREYALTLTAKSPQSLLQNRREKLIFYRTFLREKFSAVLLQNRHALQVYAEKLDGSSPLKKLTQGYSYVEDEKGKSIWSVAGIAESDELTIHVTDGKIRTRVTDVETIRRQ